MEIIIRPRQVNAVIQTVQPTSKTTMGENTALAIAKAAAAANSAAAALAAKTATEALLSGIPDAPMTGNPLQGRYYPGDDTPAGDYGMVDVEVYGALPCGVFICELKGPSAIAIAADGTEMFRDLKHIGRCVDVDQTTGKFVVNGRNSRNPATTAPIEVDYRTFRWLNSSGAFQHEWEVPSGIAGTIYGFRVCGTKLVVNMYNEVGTTGTTHMWNLDAGGYPTGSPVTLPYSGSGALARGLYVDGDLLWVAAFADPVNANSWQGELQGWSISSGTKLYSYDGHYPNDVDKMPDSRMVWIDEHFERVRAVDPSTGSVETLMASSEILANLEPDDDMTAYEAIITQRPTFGGILSESSIELAGPRTLYAPNGVSAITNRTFAIADTDNGRVIIARRSDNWRLEVVATIGILNEPTKVRLIPQA